MRDHGGFLATIVDLQGEEAVKKGVQIKSSGKYSLKGEKRREKEKEEGEGGKRREKEKEEGEVVFLTTDGRMRSSSPV